MKIQLDLPDSVITEIASAVADELERRGFTTSESRYLLVAEAAAYMRCKPQRIYDLVSQGDLKPHRDGSRLLFDPDMLDAYLADEG